jgi:hypothetical protein
VENALIFGSEGSAGVERGINNNKTGRIQETFEMLVRSIIKSWNE